MVHPDLPVKNIAELVAWRQKNPGRLSYGSAGNGSAGHLAFEYLKMTADIFMLHVPYRGTGPMMQDLLAGRLDAASVGASALLPFIKAGKVRCIATGSTARLPQLPDVPTVAEQGFAGFEMTQWYGMLAPASMPRPHVDKLAAAVPRPSRHPMRSSACRVMQPSPLAAHPSSLRSSLPSSRAAGKSAQARASQAKLSHKTGTPQARDSKQGPPQRGLSSPSRREREAAQPLRGVYFSIHH